MADNGEYRDRIEYNRVSRRIDSEMRVWDRDQIIQSHREVS